MLPAMTSLLCVSLLSFILPVFVYFLHDLRFMHLETDSNYNKVCITDFTESKMEWLGWNVWMWDKRVIPDCLEWIVIDDIDEGE